MLPALEDEALLMRHKNQVHDLAGSHKLTKGLPQ